MSLNWQDRYEPGREPDRAVRHMTPQDIPAAVALMNRIGWEHRTADWERQLYWAPDGCFVLEEAGRGIIGTVSTTSYGVALAWIGMMVVDPDRRRMGFAQQLMRAALDHLIANGVQRIMLDATEVGRPVYRKLGFRELYKVERWEGRASTYLGPRARTMRPEDVDGVLELDTRMFGVKRSHILVRLLEEYPDLAWVDYWQGQLEGYLLGRRTAAGVYLGPWMSWSIASAERLLLAALEQLQGQHITLNIPDNNGRGGILASDHNLQRVRHCTRMIYGDAIPIAGEPLAQLSIAALATG